MHWHNGRNVKGLWKNSTINPSGHIHKEYAQGGIVGRIGGEGGKQGNEGNCQKNHDNMENAVQSSVSFPREKDERAWHLPLLYLRDGTLDLGSKEGVGRR